ncbi:pyridoxal-dependent decarboxylase [Thalassospira sp.]|uniref:pyridoxal phosphate-dependent decarboxylase family protein n=1 Tax=Thalassospira sp. TaxID=1912094 RepID=UPI001B1EE631|nr:pyridoxal-dependent decarboxylase [Thalassospira sp.]MBO6807474.1 aspartate aminotransferase family protein [Thalassospira sp.]MBO6839999.1 aspartate aminotransferase family protein [Thalassospira sp.]
MNHVSNRSSNSPNVDERHLMFDDLEKLGRILVETGDIAHSFVQGVDDMDVTCRDFSAFDPSRPLQGQGRGTLDALRAAKEEILPLLAASIGPRYLGFVTGGTTPAALAGDWLASAIDQNATGPEGSVNAAVEEQVINWLCDLGGVPSDRYDGVLTTGATVSNLLGLVAARQWCGEQVGVNVDADGSGVLPDLEVFAASPHASMIKDLSITGIGRNNFTKVATKPGSEETDIADLKAKISASDARAKIVIASAGTVNATDFDDLEAIADLCAAYGAWLHVDAAFGFFAALDDRRADFTKGIARADSITSDGHKWLNVPYDCGIFLTRHIAVLETCCRAFAPYLDTKADGNSYINRGVENSRRFRALPLWMTMVAYGRDGVASVIRANCDQAADLAAWVRTHERLELFSEPKLNVTMFAARGSDEDNRALLARINATGKVFMTPTVYGGRFGFRAAFSNWRTCDDDLVIIKQAIETAL